MMMTTGNLDRSEYIYVEKNFYSSGIIIESREEKNFLMECQVRFLTIIISETELIQCSPGS